MKENYFDEYEIPYKIDGGQKNVLQSIQDLFHFLGIEAQTHFCSKWS
jgi:hypothetical protein